MDKESQIGIELYIPDNKELYDSLYACKDEIENELTFALDWRRLDDKKASRIIHFINGLNFDDHSNYNELMLEIIEKVKIMKKVFTKYIN